jgi:hypothetical protein
LKNNNSLGVELFLELPCLHAEEVHLARVAPADQMLPQKPEEYLSVFFRVAESGYLSDPDSIRSVDRIQNPEPDPEGKNDPQK